MSKFKIKPREAQETIDLYYKLTGVRITQLPNPQEKLEQVYKVLQEYVKKNAPKIHI